MSKSIADLMANARDGNGECLEWTGRIDSDGHGQTKYQGKSWYVHRLVWEMVYGPIPRGLSVTHRCDNPCCINPEHLALGTQMDNTREAFERGLISHRGMKNGRAKLTDEQVRSIRREYGILNQRELGEKYGVVQTTISMILSGRKWSHVVET